MMKRERFGIEGGMNRKGKALLKLYLNDESVTLNMEEATKITLELVKAIKKLSEEEADLKK